MRSTPRINGPYKHGRKWRVQFTVGSGSDRTTTYQVFDTRAAAEACVDGARDEAQGITVKQAVEQFLTEKRSAGLAPLSIDSYRDRLHVLLGPAMSRPVRYVRGRGDELYRGALVGKRGPRAADTHHHALEVGRYWGKWCVRRKLLKENPFSDVEPIGRRVLGADKSRLTVDECRKLDAWCRAHPDDHGAVLTLAYLLLGSRASELTARDIRDLDDDGRLLWIRAAKTPSGSRQLAIPPELTALLLHVAAGRAGTAPIFAHPDGSRWTRQLARHHVLRVCGLAGVPQLSPQALRRTQATLAIEAGQTALAVARHLGHATGEAPAITSRSYIGRDAATEAKSDRARRTINRSN